MYLTKQQLDERLAKTGLLIVQKERKVRPVGEKRLGDEERKLIAILGQDEGNTQKEIAELMGVSAQTVSNNSRGLTSPTTGVDAGLKEAIKEENQNKLENNRKVADQLLTNLSAALGHVANNLHNTDAAEASKIAVDMSKILDKVNGNSEQKNRTAIIINVPAMREEKYYQTIDV
jgi:transcriptional regulator with XRE-family HTH domain